MKTKTSKKNIKIARKSISSQIEKSLIANLKALTSESSKVDSKLAKAMKKGSAQLAKKISGLVKIDKNSVLDTSNEASKPIEEEKVVNTKKAATISSQPKTKIEEKK